MGLFVNWFAVKGMADSQRLAIREFDSFDDTTELVEQLKAEACRFRRRRAEDDRVQLALIDGATQTKGWAEAMISFSEWPDLAVAILDMSLTHWLEEAGMRVWTHRISGVHATKATRQPRSDALVMDAGVIAKAFVMPRKQAYGFTLNWHVEERFGVDLRDAKLRSIAIGKAAIRFDHNGRTSTDVHEVQRRYQGVVEDCNDTTAVVRTREGTTKEVNVSELTLEPNYEVKKAYLDLLPPSAQRATYRRAQELSYSLTASGQKNTEALKQRMQAIRNFLVGNEETEISFQCVTQDRSTLVLSLRPYKIDR
jgi:hypothetical protein